MALFLSFLIYSFLGWVCETIYCSICSGKFVNRGFLNGPFCPIYGFGALSVIQLLNPVRNNILLVFLLGLFVTSVLEYCTGYLMEALFHTKWWDYSTYPFNLHGRVCLRNSLMFGGLSVFAVSFLNPSVQRFIFSIPYWGQSTIVVVMAVYFTADSVVTVHTILELNGKLAEIEALTEELKQRSIAYREQLELKLEENVSDFHEKVALGKLELQERVELSKLSFQEKLEQTKQRALSAGIQWNDADEKRLQHLNNRLNDLINRNKFFRRRLFQAFPGMKSNLHQNALDSLKEALRKSKKK